MRNIPEEQRPHYTSEDTLNLAVLNILQAYSLNWALYLYYRSHISGMLTDGLCEFI
jgi:hypothetical protein